jgi:hypothetical protein
MTLCTLIYGNGTWKLALAEQNLAQGVGKKFLRCVAG